MATDCVHPRAFEAARVSATLVRRAYRAQHGRVDCAICRGEIVTASSAQACGRCRAVFHLTCRKREGIGVGYRSSGRDACPRCGQRFDTAAPSRSAIAWRDAADRLALRLALVAGSAFVALLGAVAILVGVFGLIGAVFGGGGSVVFFANLSLLVPLGAAGLGAGMLGVRVPISDVALPDRISHSRDPRF